MVDAHKIAYTKSKERSDGHEHRDLGTHKVIQWSVKLFVTQQTFS